MSHLIVNADDFGYTPGINRAILELHSAGALTSATLMAKGAAFKDALARLPTPLPPPGPAGAPLSIGCHVVLVDGHPCALPASVPSLLADPPRAHPRQQEQAPAFRPTLARFVADLLRGQIREEEIEREAVAQIRLLQASGIRVSHIDTHKHTHVFPQVLRPLLRASLQCGVRAVRNPFEPAWSLRATISAPLLRRAEMRLLPSLRPAFLRLVAEAGLATTHGSLGILATGTLDEAALDRLLAAAAAQPPHSGQLAWELVCHPGYHDEALASQRTRLVAARETERAALLSRLHSLQQFSLINYSWLTSAAGKSI